MHPALLILDEPTSILDPTATAQVLEVLDVLNQQKQFTVIIIEHKLNFLQEYNPRHVMLENGSISYDGPLKREHINIYTLHQSEQVSSKQGKAKRTLLALNNINIQVSPTFSLSIPHLEIHTGDLTGLIGDNGSGKTTLLKAAAGLLKIGRDKNSMFGADENQDFSQIGFVFQNPDHQLFMPTVAQEALLGYQNFREDKAISDKKLKSWFTDFRLAEQRDRNPFQISFGQKRRLNLLSVLLYQPSILFLDEILIGQDFANVQFIMRKIQNYVRKGNAAILALHNPDIVFSFCNRVIYLENGKIILDLQPKQAMQYLQKKGIRAYQPSGEMQ